MKLSTEEIKNLTRNKVGELVIQLTEYFPNNEDEGVIHTSNDAMRKIEMLYPRNRFGMIKINGWTLLEKKMTDTFLVEASGVYALGLSRTTQNSIWVEQDEPPF